jgi:ribosomal-protein-alanine N-acetyltransferase
MISYRSYRSGDTDAMYALDVVCFERPFRFSRRSMRGFAEDSSARVVVAEENEALVGFVIVQIEPAERGLSGYIVTLDVDPNHRRRGVAGSLMCEIEAQVTAEGCASLMLHVFVDNAGAVRFYTGQGFLRLGRVKAFYGSGRDAWLYQKDLTDLQLQPRAE